MAKRYCIVGAGASGLAVAKTFAERGIAFDCFEALADIGGLWNPDSPHAVYGSTYLNSSEEAVALSGFQLPGSMVALCKLHAGASLSPRLCRGI